MEITNAQKSILRKRGNAMQPFAMIGKNGLTPSIIQVIDKTLEIHEIIKIRFQDFQDEKREIAEQIAEQTSSVIVDIIGNVLLMYRQNPDPAKRKISFT